MPNIGRRNHKKFRKAEKKEAPKFHVWEPALHTVTLHTVTTLTENYPHSQLPQIEVTTRTIPQSIKGDNTSCDTLW